MSVEVGINYSSYANSYTSSVSSRKNTAESSTTQEAAESNAAQKTAVGTSGASVGMSYLQSLQKAYSGTLFMTGTVSYGQTYGNSSSIAFVVNPSYVSKLGTDPEARSQFEESVEYLYNFSQNFRAQQAANGWEVISEGWFCDENGNWGGWCAVRKTDEKSFLQKMQEESDEIMKEKTEKRQELKKSEEKREAEKAASDDNDKKTDKEKIKIRDNRKADISSEKAEFKAQIEEPLKKHFGDRWKGMTVIDKDDKNEPVSKSSPKKAASQLEKAIEESLKNHPPKIIQAKEMKAEISGDIRAEKVKRLEKQLKEGTFKNSDELDMKV
ncbi:MAG: hypothetical protein NC394_07145 [Bacteroides sp.]|nr:hypothetical protein [Bacteroides sp.]